MKIELHRLAKQEIREARDWYNEQKTGLGIEFIDHLQDFAEQILKNPFQYRMVYRDIRRDNVPKPFPYVILFRIIPGGIRITTVKHEKRRPDHGQRRT